MTTRIYQSIQKRFYLQSVDVIQGILVLMFIWGHTLVWWRYEITINFHNAFTDPTVRGVVYILLGMGMGIFPYFMFLFAFNQTNSLLRRGKDPNERKVIRWKYINRALIFFALGFVKQIIGSLLFRPSLFFQHLFAWEIFHMFGFATLFILFGFEVAWHMEKWGLTNKRYSAIFLSGLGIVVLTSIFLLFHDYTGSYRVTYYLQEISLEEIILSILFDRGSAPIVPFLLFALAGVSFALVLDLPNSPRESLKKRFAMVFAIGGVISMMGFLILPYEHYMSPALLYPVSSSLLFIACGYFFLITGFLLLVLDYSHDFSRKRPPIYLTPLTVLSKITLTVYIVHNVLFVMDPAWFPNEWSPLVLGPAFGILFILVAFVWSKWKFKYSIEWLISSIENMVIDQKGLTGALEKLESGREPSND